MIDRNDKPQTPVIAEPAPTRVVIDREALAEIKTRRVKSGLRAGPWMCSGGF